ncbi:hypothetical protein [Synechococcus sp. MVIR-18-1]|uniref:hypothetical protein n=1 Tax=Synechococcus sp. MVIR-18-1 TaxID=1386941 RepID=UPI001647CE3A|nr:hypothetical protein [Synechococcus sp. MVIR-18-1]QNI75235.1 hypothetical protein SynMVIR181_00221 [Synechococcus sp. MVIR-18-1]
MSDPSGRYAQFSASKFPFIPRNVVFLSKPHPFIEILRSSDLFIRNTSTDGDSISIWEALSLIVNVFATDVVSRPPGVTLYSSIEELTDLLGDFNPKCNAYANSNVPSLDELADFYLEIY